MTFLIESKDGTEIHTKTNSIMLFLYMFTSTDS